MRVPISSHFLLFDLSPHQLITGCDPLFPLVQRVTFLSLGLSISAPPWFSYTENWVQMGWLLHIEFSTWRYLKILA